MTNTQEPAKRKSVSSLQEKTYLFYFCNISTIHENTQRVIKKYQNISTLQFSL